MPHTLRQTQGLDQMQGLGLGVAPFFGGGQGAAREHAGGQQHIGLHIEVGQQIELLKNHTHVFAAQAVASHAAEPRHVLAQHLELAVADLNHACQHAQQGAFAAAARALNEQVFTLQQHQLCNVKQRRRMAPSVRKLRELKGVGHGLPAKHRIFGFECDAGLAFGTQNVNLQAT